MRSTSEWVAGFVCGNFHTFFVLLADAAPQLETKKFNDIQKNVRRFRNARSTLRSGGLAMLNSQPDEPPGWCELQELALQKRDLHKLARIVDQMNDLLANYEKKANRNESSPLEPDGLSTQIH